MTIVRPIVLPVAQLVAVPAVGDADGSSIPESSVIIEILARDGSTILTRDGSTVIARAA